MDYCGVDYYDADSTEGAISDDAQSLSSLLAQVSYSSSFIEETLKAAQGIGIKEAYGVLAQFDFAYDRNKVTKQVAQDSIFVGYFDWHD